MNAIEKLLNKRSGNGSEEKPNKEREPSFKNMEAMQLEVYAEELKEQIVEMSSMIQLHSESMQQKSNQFEQLIPKYQEALKEIKGESRDVLNLLIEHKKTSSDLMINLKSSSSEVDQKSKSILEEFRRILEELLITAKQEVQQSTESLTKSAKRLGLKQWAISIGTSLLLCLVVFGLMHYHYKNTLIEAVKIIQREDYRTSAIQLNNLYQYINEKVYPRASHNRKKKLKTLYNNNNLPVPESWEKTKKQKYKRR